MTRKEVEHIGDALALLCDGLKRLELAVTSGDEADLHYYAQECAKRRRLAQDVILNELTPKVDFE